jgi:hypothetical protein
MASQSANRSQHNKLTKNENKIKRNKQPEMQSRKMFNLPQESHTRVAQDQETENSRCQNVKTEKKKSQTGKTMTVQLKRCPTKRTCFELFQTNNFN